MNQQTTIQIKTTEKNDIVDRDDSDRSSDDFDLCDSDKNITQFASNQIKNNTNDNYNRLLIKQDGLNLIENNNQEKKRNQFEFFFTKRTPNIRDIRS